MFGIDSGEFVVIAIVALVVIGPKDLPRVMRLVGQWVGKARAMTRHVRSGFDAMMREAELEEMQKQWDAQNAAIIASTQVSHPFPPAPQMLPLDAQPTMPETVQPEITADTAREGEASIAEPVDTTLAGAPHLKSAA